METVDVIDEVSQNFLDGSYEINTNRAFPNVLDGLKPGQRACLWEMWNKKYFSSKPHVKSAKVSGGVIASWHPHGDQAIYETFVHMAQPFANNIPTIDFHGACGNIILGGDSFASSRYTEVRLAKIVEDGMFCGIDKNAVDMIFNFSEDEKWPKVLPSVFPNLLVNGTQGLGVGLANYWLPHSFTETAEVINKYIDTEKVDADNYFPDFPTGGTIVNKDDLPKINKTGTGKVIVEASYKINGKEINFYEMPFQVYIEPVIEEIKKNIEEEKITGIKEVLNKSDKKRILLTVVCSSDPERVVQQLFANTSLRTQYNANQNGIVSKTPIMLTLEDMLRIYVEHNTTCIKREYQFDLEKTAARLHILDGLKKAINNIDRVVEIIRNEESPKEKLMEEFNIDNTQVDAILSMKLSKLSKLEVSNFDNEIENLTKNSEYYNKVVNDYNEQKTILKERLNNLVKKYGDKRRSEVIQKEIKKTTKQSAGGRKEVVIENVIVQIDANGYLKNIPIKNYRASKKEYIFTAKTDTSDIINLYTNRGRLFRIALKNIKTCSSTDKGNALGAILPLEQGEKILAANCNNAATDHNFIAFLTNTGRIKKTDISQYAGTTQNLRGSKCMNLDEDIIIDIKFGYDYQDFSILTEKGYGISFESGEVSYQGKTASGVKGITLRDGDSCVSLTVNGALYKVQKRGGKGSKVD